jgi:hypothetical protein
MPALRDQRGQGRASGDQIGQPSNPSGRCAGYDASSTSSSERGLARSRVVNALNVIHSCDKCACERLNHRLCTAADDGLRHGGLSVQTASAIRYAGGRSPAAVGDRPIEEVRCSATTTTGWISWRPGWSARS